MSLEQILEEPGKLGKLLNEADIQVARYRRDNGDYESCHELSENQDWESAINSLEEDFTLRTSLWDVRPADDFERELAQFYDGELVVFDFQVDYLKTSDAAGVVEGVPEEPMRETFHFSGYHGPELLPYEFD